MWDNITEWSKRKRIFVFAVAAILVVAALHQLFF